MVPRPAQRARCRDGPVRPSPKCPAARRPKSRSPKQSQRHCEGCRVTLAKDDGTGKGRATSGGWQHATVSDHASPACSVLGLSVVKAAARDRPVLAESRRVHNTEPAVPVVRQAAPLQTSTARTGVLGARVASATGLRCSGAPRLIDVEAADRPSRAMADVRSAGLRSDLQERRTPIGRARARRCTSSLGRSCLRLSSLQAGCFRCLGPVPVRREGKPQSNRANRVCKAAVSRSPPSAARTPV
jgi:hypothetical protein